jgi:hypothetical protein
MMGRWRGRGRCGPIALSIVLAGVSLIGAAAALAGRLSWERPVPLRHGRLYAVQCGREGCFAAANGYVLYAAAPSRGAKAWTAHQVAPRIPASPYHASYLPEISHLSCPTRSFCGATGGGASVITTASANRRGFWRRTNLPMYTTDSIACPGARLCVAVGSGGLISASTHPLRGRKSWSAVYADSKQLSCNGGATQPNSCQAEINDVACPSVHLCIAVDDGGDILVSTDPMGGASAWTVRNVLAAPPDPGIGLFGHITCPSASLCAAVEENHAGRSGADEVAISTDPASRTAIWNTTSLPSGDSQVRSISCASAALCALVEDNGNVLTTTDPTAQRPTWTSRHIDRPSNQSEGLLGIACPSHHECVAVDGYGDVVLGIRPA